MRFGRYHLLSRLRNDPVSVSFLAAWGVDEGAEQLRVLRCMAPSVAQESHFIGRFLGEARALSRLNSANVARIMEVGQIGEVPFVAYEHTAGLPLDRLLFLLGAEGRSLPWELALHVAAECLRGLDYVHRREDGDGQPLRMCHGDLRPENIALSFGGEVRLCHFGATLRHIENADARTRLHTLRAVFLPPEDEGDTATPAADLWAVGLLLLILLGKTLPIARDAVAAALSAARGSRERPAHLLRLPGEVDDFLAQALHANPAHRFPTAAAMRAALLEIMAAHVDGHPPDDLASRVQELGLIDHNDEGALVRRMLGQLASTAPVSATPAATAAGGIGPGEVLDGRYRLLRLLGEGGMGLVYEAEHMGLDRKVALKVLHERVVDDDRTVERFRREARIIARLGHPNIVGALDFGQSDAGHHYLVMELLEGKSLAQRIWEDSLPLSEAAVALAEVCDGLQAAHDAGVIHRDLKPDNIFLTPKGARILDFGIAKSTGLDMESSALTHTGHICGTVDYIAPEQIRGTESDLRSDIYAVGVILYEVLTGVTPFHGRTVGETLHKAINDKVVPPKKCARGRDVPPKLEAICLKALAKKPAQRFASAKEMGRALRRVAQVSGHVALVAVPPSNAVVKRREFPAISAGILLALLVFAAGMWSALRNPSSPLPSHAAASRAQAAEVETPAHPSDTAAPSDTTPTSDTTPSDDTAASDDTTPSDDTAPLDDTAPPNDTATSSDTAPPAPVKTTTFKGAQLRKEGERFLRYGNFAQAKQAFLAALQHDERDGAALFGLGQVAFQEGHYIVAQTHVERALRQAPKNHRRRNFLGVVLHAMGRTSEAVVQWQRVLADEPQNAEAAAHLQRTGVR